MPGMSIPTPLEAAQRIVQVFEQLRSDRLDTLAQIYAAQATFADPFTRVQGLAAITGQFAHMYARLHAPRFAVREVVAQGDVVWLTWEFHFAWRAGGVAHCIDGASRLQLDAQGRIASHRDYWDACAFYATLPLLGAVVRAFRRAAGP